MSRLRFEFQSMGYGAVEGVSLDNANASYCSIHETAQQSSPVLNFVIRPIKFAADEDAVFEHGLIDLLINLIIITIIIISTFTGPC